MKKTLYQVLGVEPNASAQDITAAYQRALDTMRTQAGGAQPDRNALMFLREAHQVLSDPARRAAYDAALKRQDDAVAHTIEITSATTNSGWFKWAALGVATLALVVWWTTRTTNRPPTEPTRDAVSVQQGAGEATAVAPRQVSNTATPRSSGPAGNRSAEDVFRQVAASVVLVTLTDNGGRTLGHGSGVVIAPGTVITNCHVALRGARVSVKSGADTRLAFVETADETFDLCRLNVGGLDAPAVEVAGVSSLRTGQRVFAIGAPHGLELTISDGIVSSLRDVPEGTVIQTTAPISPGSSGGGLFDSAGRLVGITTFQHRFGQNLNFAVPADWIRDMRPRSAGNATMRPFAATQPPTQSNSPDAGTRSMIVGRWFCFGPVTGWNGDFQFDEDGVVSIVARGKPSGGRYAVRGKVLVLEANPPIALAIDTLTQQQMVLKGSDGNSTVCERKA